MGGPLLLQLRPWLQSSGAAPSTTLRRRMHRGSRLWNGRRMSTMERQGPRHWGELAGVVSRRRKFRCPEPSGAMSRLAPALVGDSNQFCRNCSAIELATTVPSTSSNSSRHASNLGSSTRSGAPRAPSGTRSSMKFGKACHHLVPSWRGNPICSFC
eukprot:4055497-Pyramimonas_sp.AAC.1